MNMLQLGLVLFTLWCLMLANAHIQLKKKMLTPLFVDDERKLRIDTAQYFSRHGNDAVRCDSGQLGQLN